MKYRRKTPIEAEQYKPGMEDGYACYNCFSGHFVGYFKPGDKIPRTAQKVAYINTQRGKMELTEGDYIVTDNNERYPVKGEFFELNYEREV